MLERKVDQQNADIQNKRFAIYETMRQLEDQQREVEENISDCRLQLARKQEDNQKLGHSLKIKNEQASSFEDEIRDIKRVYERLGELDRERKEDGRVKVGRLKSIW